MTADASDGASATDAGSWVEAFAEGWRSPAGPDAFADHFEVWVTEDVRMVQPQVPTAVGRQAFREEFARPIFAIIPDLHATVDGWAARGNQVLIEFTLEGTLGGRTLRWSAVDRVTLRDGLAAERVSYFDPLPILLAVASRPRAWPSFIRMQASQLRTRLTKGGRQ
jgi:ketosteroid isomerase-like protein